MAVNSSAVVSVAPPPNFLLATKLAMPTTQQRRVVRSRIQNKLLANGIAPLSVVCAPAGFGKTTALVCCLEQSQLPVAWLALDEGDNDIRRFLEYLVAAIQAVIPNAGAAVLPSLSSATPPNVSRLIPALITELQAESQLFILALDDYHLIENDDVHQAISLLLEHGPETLRVALTSRSTPPLPLSRMRVQGRMVEITESDLRFTEEEALRFFRESAGLDLEEKDVVMLEQRTEGWAAGLQLAALSLQGEDDKKAFIDAFAGNDRFITDYLTEEVLRLQTDTVRAFLLQSSILERLNGPLCDAVTGRDDSAELLQRLEQSDMFIIPLDSRRCWYRYHHLFSDLLKAQLLQLHRASVNALHVRASQWFNENGFPEEAMKHAFLADDFNQAIRVLSLHAQQLFMQGRFSLLGQWFERIPLNYLRGNICLLIKYAWNLYVGYGVFNDALIAEIEQFIQSDDIEATKEEIGHVTLDLILMRGFRALQNFELDEAINIGMQLLDEAACYGVNDKAAPYLQLGVTYSVGGELDKAVDALTRSEQDALSSNALVCLNGAVGCRAMCLIRQGKLNDAQDLLQQALARLKENGWDQQLVDTSWLYVGLAKVAYEQNELDIAESYLAQASGYSEMDNWDTIAAMVDIRRARIAFIQSETSNMEEALTRFDGCRIQPALLPIMPLPEFERQSLMLMSGELDAVGRWLNGLGLDASAEMPDGYENEYRLLAHYLVLNHQEDEAIIALDKLLSKAECQERTGDMVELLVLQAMAHHSLHNADKANEYLVRALKLGESQGYVRTFLDSGPAMLKMLTEVQDGDCENIVAKLLDGFKGRVIDAPTQMETLLSKKELKTLSLLARGLSNNEIAAQSFVSVNTVKTHLKNIYSKLDVDSRHQAIQRAKEHGL